jgi:hypothetical protein
MSDFLPIEWPWQNYGQYQMVATYPLNYQYVMPEQYLGEYDYRKVVDPKRNTIWVIYPTNERSGDNYFLCLISPYSKKDIYFLGIMNMSTNICYYLKYTIYNNCKISYYEDIYFVQHQIDIYDILIYDEHKCYIGVVQSWVNDFLLKNRYLVTKIGDYRICNAKALSPTNAREMSPVNTREISPVNMREMSPVNMREMSPVNMREMSPVNMREMSPVNMREMSPTNARALSPVQIPIAIAVIQEQIPIATVVKLDDIVSEDDKIAMSISEYKTKEDLEKYIAESFKDLSVNNKKLSFDISKTESSIEWNKFFRSVILLVGIHYFNKHKNKRLRFKINGSNIVFTLT